MVKPDEDYFSKEDDVFHEWIRQIQAAIDNVEGPDNIYVDATHISEKSRNKTLNHLNLNEDIKLFAVYMKTSLEDCLARNANRSGRECVPKSVIRNMRQSFRAPDPLFEKYQYTVIEA